MSGFKKGNQVNKGRTPWNKGLKYSQEFKSTKKKIGAPKGTTPWNKDETHPSYEEYLVKMKDRNGGNNPCWQGGKKRYGAGWRKLRKEIVLRDGSRCQECFRHQTELKNTLEVHHIDYDTLNNNENNLITLCKICHAQINWDATKWIPYFRNKLKGGC